MDLLVICRLIVIAYQKAQLEKVSAESLLKDI